MAIRIKSLDEMIREIIASLQTAENKRHPAFTLLLGSGFSFPIIPTPTQMLKGDIAWWRQSKNQTKFGDRFRHRADCIAEKLVTQDEISAFEREFWKPIHAKAVEKQAPFALGSDGVPELAVPNDVGLAYQAVMAEGLMNNKMRRQYLRDAIARSYPKVNGAHIFLAGILEVQETWDWGAPFCRTIFTTNFDPLLQRSLQLVNKLYYMTDRPDVLEPPDDDQSEAIHLVYTHGSVHRYDLLNTEDQIKHAKEQNAPALIDYFRRHGVIVIGYSGWADTTMEALSSCASFDSNLYWCDIHAASEAETRLRPEVLEILQRPEKGAYYVPIAGADEAMRLLHGELKLGPVPKFIRSPVATIIDQLKSIEVPSEVAASIKPEATPLSTSLKSLLDGTLTRLQVAMSAFDDPSIVKSGSAQGQEEVARALIAQLLSDGLVAYFGGRRDHAITLWSTVINTPGVPSKDRAAALFDRGAVSAEMGEAATAYADYTTLIDMPDAPARLKALAFFNRGVSLGQSGETTKEIADYTAVIDMTDAPVELKADALLNRAISWGQNGETPKEVADYTALIEMPDASPEHKAKARNYRGLFFRQSGETRKAIEDHTAVIDMPDGPVDQRVLALVNRGWILYADLDDVQSMVSDSQKALELEDGRLSARSNLALGLLLTGQADAALDEYNALLSRTSDLLVIQTTINNLETALRTRPEIPEAAQILEHLRTSITANSGSSANEPANAKTPS
jgi:tetratricopeptide (TPR) repeat protein